MLRSILKTKTQIAISLYNVEKLMPSTFQKFPTKPLCLSAAYIRNITTSITHESSTNTLSSARTPLQKAKVFTPMQLNCNFQTTRKQENPNAIVMPDMSRVQSGEKLASRALLPGIFSSVTDETETITSRHVISTCDAFARHVISASGVASVLDASAIS